jgi:prefoldin beta subunit
MDKEQINKLTSEYQSLQEQIQSLSLQKAQLSEQNEEFKIAAAELDKAKGKVYSAIGGAIVETTGDEAKKELKERQESVEMRLNIVNKQYDDAIKKEKSLRQQIESMIKNENPNSK